MDKGLFRKESVEHISSPEQLHDYMRVTSPKLWMILSAILALLIGFVVFSFTTTMESTVTVRGTLTPTGALADVPISKLDLIKIRMPVRVNGRTGYIGNIYQASELRLEMRFDNGRTLEDGYYEMTLEEAPGMPEELKGVSVMLSVSGGVMTCSDSISGLDKYLSSDRRVRIDGDLATVIGAEPYDIATLDVVLEGEVLSDEEGPCDVEIITESTTPMSFLLN